MSSAATPPTDPTFNLAQFRASKAGKQLVDWVHKQHDDAKSAVQSKQQGWARNMAMFYGNQWLTFTSESLKPGFSRKMMPARGPHRGRRLTVNRTRTLVRTELAKFTAQEPSARAVPATSSDEDIRAAYSAEQVWEAVSAAEKLSAHYRRAMWWVSLTGNGFLKTWWDQSRIDKVSGQPGAISYGSVSPFNLFVPDLREQEIEDQPWVMSVYTKPVEWCQMFFGAALDGVTLTPSVSSANQLLDAHKLNLSAGADKDSCLVYEAWLKPGAHKQFPQGGFVQLVDDHLVLANDAGLPYQHGQYPFTHFTHIPTGTFYADSPLEDTNALQREYNVLRSEISEAGHRMARPQILAQKGSIVASKMTNETGLVIEYRPGTAPPQPIPLSPLPAYYVQQQEVILSDWEDLSGQHEVSKGSAPAGITAGTAINFLQEKDDSYLNPEYAAIEEGYEKLAAQTVELFVQFVDIPRKIKTVGADGTFDTLLLCGADVASGTDIRMEKGSSIAQSQAARQSQIMSMVGMGILAPQDALRLMEIGGVQKVLDTLQVAERKAQRENIKMKSLTPEAIQAHEMVFQLGALQSGTDQIPADGQPTPPGQAAPQGQTQYPDDPSAITDNNPLGPPDQNVSVGPVIPVDDFDNHAVHIDTHQKFMMGQEYEALPVEIKQQFKLHVQVHKNALMGASLQSFLAQIPSDGTDGTAPGPSNAVPVPGGPQKSANGAVPDLSGAGN